MTVVDRTWTAALRPTAPPPPSPAPPASGGGGGEQPAIERAGLHRWLPLAGLAGVMVLALVLDCWALSKNGYGNTYYAAAARSMTESWRNFFFAAFDPGGFISVDKPPVALWFEAASARIFGYSSWSLLLPGAIAGAATVGVLWSTVRRLFGSGAAFVAALVLAISPISVAVNRLNLPEPFMILFLVTAAWAVVRSFESRRCWAWLVGAGVLIGLAFNTKMLGAMIPVPAIGIAAVLGSRGDWWRRLGKGAVLTAVSLLVAASWMVAVDLVPASSRPYVGGSTDNTVADLVLGYNGFGRIDGDGQGAPGGGGPGGALGGPGGIFGGRAGWLRMFSDAVGGQIAWFLPAAAVGAVVAIWAFRRERTKLAAAVLFGGWLLLCTVVFSQAQGIFHSYYTSLMAPAIGALVGIGGVGAVRLARRRPAVAAVAVGALVVTAAVQLVVTGRAPGFHDWTRPLLVALTAGAVVVLVAASLHPRTRRFLVAGLGVGLAALCVAPAAWAVSEAVQPPTNSTLPQAGPRGGAAERTFGSAGFDGDAALAAFLREANSGERWDLVTSSAMGASGLIAQEGISVMALGGFLGTDPAATPASFAELVAKGEVRFVQIGGFGVFGRGGAGGGGFQSPAGRLPGGGQLPGGQTPGGGRPGTGRFPGGQPGGGGFQPPGGTGGTGGGRGSANAVLADVRQVCTPVTSTTTGGALPAQYDGQLYDCAGSGAALASLATA